MAELEGMMSMETVNNLKALQETVGEFSASLQLQVDGDWRLLLGGVMFGFLVLAAAKGLLTTQRRRSAV